MALAGALLERLLLRPMIGEPHFAVLMLTIGLGFVLRAAAGAIWGNEPRALDLPYAGIVWQWDELVVGAEDAAIVGGTLLLCGLLYLFFRFTRVGIAMQGRLAESACGLLRRHSRQARLFAGLGALRR